MKDLDVHEFNKLTAIQLAELYKSSEDSKEEFLKILGRILGIASLDVSSLIKIWVIAYLRDIRNSDESIHDKLHEIARVWSMMNYPSDWKNFIFYMPVENNEYSDEKILYQKFINYLELIEGTV